MPCTDRRRRWRHALTGLVMTAAALLAGCASGPREAPSSPQTVALAATVAQRAEAARVRLPAPARPRNADELQQQFARRLVAAHPGTSYTGDVPDSLFAIPVLEVELAADGSVRNIVVLREPTSGPETTRLAIAAVRRAAPYGDVSRLPRPWKVVEVFLFDDALRFKPRTLDVD